MNLCNVWRLKITENGHEINRLVSERKETGNYLTRKYVTEYTNISR
jgi:hypothetical protein